MEWCKYEVKGLEVSHHHPTGVLMRREYKIG